MMESKPTVLTFEDIKVGDEISTSERIITGTEVAEFVSLTGDNTKHKSEEFGGNETQAAPVVNGALVLSMVIGMVSQTCLLNQTIIGFLDMHIRFIKAVMFNDTIRATVRIVSKKNTSKADRGIVVIRVIVYNQCSEVVQDCDWTLMVRKKVI